MTVLHNNCMPPLCAWPCFFHFPGVLILRALANHLPQENLHIQGHFQGKDCKYPVPPVHKEPWRVSATSLRMKDNLDPSSSLCGIHSCVCVLLLLGFPGGASGKELACRCRSCNRRGLDPWVKKVPWRRAWQPTPVFLPGKSQWTEEPGDYSPKGRKEEATWHSHALAWFEALYLILSKLG